MPETGTQFGIFGMALVRAAEAMLRSLGGSEIRLLLPYVSSRQRPERATGIDRSGHRRGAALPRGGAQPADDKRWPRRRVEFLIPAAAVSEELSSRNVSSAETFFDGVMGVVYDSDLFHIEGFTTEYFGGMAYLYRLVGVE